MSERDGQKEDTMDNIICCWDTLMDMGVSAETLNTVTDINGLSVETLEDVLFARFGYRSFEQLWAEEDEED